jgi:hypothetical protein
MSRPLLVLQAVLISFGLSACGSRGTVNPSTAVAPNKGPGFFISSWFPSRVKIVKVRHKDLKDLPLGHERALAFARERKFGFWSFGGAVDFKQPALPEPGAEMDGSLLPPKIP